MRPMRLSDAAQKGLVAALPFFFTLLIRLPMVGGSPRPDECMYSLRGRLFVEGAKATEFSPLDLYPAIAVTLVGIPEATPLLHLRIFDAFVAAAASAAVGLFLWRWAASMPALAMAIGWALAANDPLYVRAGFHNSIMAATLVFVAAMTVLSVGARWSAFVAGMLIPIAPLLREAFFLVPIVSIYLATALRGRKGFLEHLAGLFVGGLPHLAWIVPMRGPPATILGYYKDRGMTSRFIRCLDLWDGMASNLRAFLEHSSWFLIPAILGLICLVPARTPQPRRFWVAGGLALLLPISHLYEIFGVGKRVTAYHWSQLLVTAAFLGAMGLHRTGLLARAKGVPWVIPRLYLGLAMTALLVGSVQTFSVYRQAWRLSKQFAPVMISGNWDHPVVRKSFDLTLAKFLRDHARPTDRVLTSGRYPMSAYSLTGLHPISPEIIDLSRFQLMNYHERRPELFELLRAHPPDFLVEGLRTDYIEPDFREIWPDFDARFELIEAIPPDSRMFSILRGARIYHLRE